MKRQDENENSKKEAQEQTGVSMQSYQQFHENYEVESTNSADVAASDNDTNIFVSLDLQSHEANKGGVEVCSAESFLFKSQENVKLENAEFKKEESLNLLKSENVNKEIVDVAQMSVTKSYTIPNDLGLIKLCSLSEPDSKEHDIGTEKPVDVRSGFTSSKAGESVLSEDDMVSITTNVCDNVSFVPKSELSFHQTLETGLAFENMTFPSSVSSPGVVSADVFNTEADVLNTKADVLNTEADVLNTEADVLNTEADVQNTKADVVNIEDVEKPCNIEPNVGSEKGSLMESFTTAECCSETQDISNGLLLHTTNLDIMNVSNGLDKSENHENDANVESSKQDVLLDTHHEDASRYNSFLPEANKTIVNHLIGKDLPLSLPKFDSVKVGATSWPQRMPSSDSTSEPALMASVPFGMISKKLVSTKHKSQPIQVLPTKDDDEDLADIIMRSMMSSIVFTDARAISFPLLNQFEELLIKGIEDFINRLGCEPHTPIKVVSIFGNSGDGKSYTLNETFFEGEPVFKTSTKQNSCTLGVWAAYDKLHGAILLDTEGMLGVSNNPNQRARLLLKVLAISDIVIYRTRAERLHSDLFHFLGDASKAYLKHFSIQLRAASRRFQLDASALSTLGPCLIIFHETLHTEVLGKGASEVAEQIIRARFKEMNLECDAFSSIQYVGTQTTGLTSFTGLLVAVKKQLNNNEIRSPRQPGVVLRTLEILNSEFAGSIENENPNLFPDQYFTCRMECLACQSKCSQTMNHTQDDVPHEALHKCIKNEKYQNTVYYCKKCYKKGNKMRILPKTSTANGNLMSFMSYTWTGYVMECPICGPVYHSRKYWYGNLEPEVNAVVVETLHVWPDGKLVLQDGHYTGQRLIDQVSQITETIATASAAPLDAVSSWAADKVAPPYWDPNSKNLACSRCGKQFDWVERRHHCRSCGGCVCQMCSSRKRPVPEKGWGDASVRVCDDCYNKPSNASVSEVPVNESHLYPRKASEYLGSTIEAISSIVKYPLSAIKDAARPTYWVPDDEIKSCCVCKRPFNTSVKSFSSNFVSNSSGMSHEEAFKAAEVATPLVVLKLHHCRSCGHGVCRDCSSFRPVRSRGWNEPVRCCDICNQMKDL